MVFVQRSVFKTDTRPKPVNCLNKSVKFFNFPSRQEIQIPHQKARWLIMVISDNIFGNSRQKHNYQNIFTFLSRGKPWILIIFPDNFSVSFQFNSWTFLYFSIATYIINARDYFLKENNKFFYHYLLILLIFVLHTNYPQDLRKYAIYSVLSIWNSPYYN